MGGLGASESAYVVSGSSIKKCSGVKAAKSFESLHKGVSGREFRIASILKMTVSNSSCVMSNEDVKTLLLFDLTAVSHNPPSSIRNKFEFYSILL